MSHQAEFFKSLGNINARALLCQPQMLGTRHDIYLWSQSTVFGLD
jgi:hypothetical protein